MVQLHGIKNTVSPFLDEKKSWDDESDFPIRSELRKGIIEELNFSKPSYIQSITIPLIMKTG